MKSHLMLMGEKASEAVESSIRALVNKDLELAEKVIESDDEIDSLEIEIDHEATRYLTLRSPVASDLRLITVAIKASHDLERVGDEAHNIAKRVRTLILKSAGDQDLIKIPEMAEKAKSMLRLSLECFINEESDMANDVLESDAVILATPAYASARMVRGLEPKLAAELDDIRYSSAAIVTLAFD